MVSTCRSSYDLAQHLCDRLSSESTDESQPSRRRAEVLTAQMSSLQDEFQQLELLAKTRESHLRDERYINRQLLLQLVVVVPSCVRFINYLT